MMHQATPSITGMIATASDRRVTGWIDAGAIESAVPLTLTVEGRESGCAARYGPPRHDEAAGRSVVDFTFESEDPFSPTRLFSVAVETPRGPLAPSPLLVDRSDHRTSTTWCLDDIDAGVIAQINRQTSVVDLQASVARLAAWFGLAIDRLNAVRAVEENGKRAIADLLNNHANNGGTLQHVLGILSENYPPLAATPVTKPTVSIIIPVHNKFQLTYDCVRSIIEHRAGATYEIVIVDDCSTDETILAKLVFDGPVKIVRTERNMGFVGACNTGMRAAKGDYVVFLNNDTLVGDDWLGEMVGTFSRFDRVGIVGARLLFGDGRLQECGGIVWKDASAWNWGRSQSADDWRFRFARDADYVSGAALMISASLLNELAGFDPYFAPAYYEDTDLCFRVRQAGYRVMVQPAATIIHLEGQSNGTNTASGLKRYQVLNRDKFAKRWADVLQAHQPNGVDVPQALARYVKRRALFIDDTMLTPDQDAGSNAALQHIMSLQRLGFEVTFVPANNMTDIKPYSNRLEAQGVECIYAQNFWSLEDFVRRDKRSFDLIYLHRFSNADLYLQLCRGMRPDARIVYNVADLHSMREERAAEVDRRSGAFGAKASVSKDREFSLIASADAVIVHSSAEKTYLENHGIDADIHVVPWTIPMPADDAVPAFADTRDIAFIGGFRHAPNVDAILWFFKEVLPHLMKRDKTIRVKVIGSHMPEEFKQIDHPNIDVVGFVDNLDAELRRTRLTIAPLRYGAGIKGKVLSSLAAGIPCVMTAVAAEGIPLGGRLAALVADQPESFAQAIKHAYDNEEEWTQVSRLGRSLIDMEFSAARIDDRIKRLLINLHLPGITGE